MRDPIVVVPYDPAWPALFTRLAAPMRAALGDVALRIDHIGSTAVPGLDAKPIIDIQISVAALEPVDTFQLPLERLGYEFRTGNDDRSKRYFRERPGDRRTHIHVRCAGNWSEQFRLLFRDYLRHSEEDAAEYARVKYALSEQYRHDRPGYVEAKSDIIWEITRRADRWAQAVGWQPGPSDA